MYKASEKPGVAGSVEAGERGAAEQSCPGAGSGRAADQSAGGKATRKEKSFWNKFCFLIGFFFWNKNLSRTNENQNRVEKPSRTRAMMCSQFREGQSNSTRRRISLHGSPCLANTSPDTTNTVIWQEHFSKPLQSFLMVRTSFHQKYSPRTMFVFKIQLCLAGCTIFIGWSEIKGLIAWLSSSDLFSRGSSA